jgi:hypothetical protein
MLIGSLLLFVGSRRRLPTLAVPMIFLVCMATSCGNGSPSRTGGTGTPSGTYIATITGTSGNVSHQTTLTVIVK